MYVRYANLQCTRGEITLSLPQCESELSLFACKVIRSLLNDVRKQRFPCYLDFRQLHLHLFTKRRNINRFLILKTFTFSPTLKRRSKLNHFSLELHDVFSCQLLESAELTKRADFLTRKETNSTHHNKRHLETT